MNHAVFFFNLKDAILKTVMPSSMAATKTKTLECPDPIETIAGPGQKTPRDSADSGHATIEQKHHRRCEPDQSTAHQWPRKQTERGCYDCTAGNLSSLQRIIPPRMLKTFLKPLLAAYSVA